MLLSILVLDSTQPGLRYSKDATYEALLAQMAKGETLALEQLYFHTRSAVYGFALSILKQPHDAEDVMQSAYIRIFQAADRYKPQGKPMAWMLTIVRNLALSRLRSMPANELALLEELTPSASSDFTEASVDRIVLQSALQILSDEECQIILLHSLTGLKHREIAELLELPLSTVLSKYHRSLSKLKKMLKEEAK